MEDVKNMQLIKGDASSRKFFRKKNNKSSSIIIFSPSNKKKNLLDYDAVNKILIKNKIKAPKLIKENYKKNMIELEDFGDKTIFKIINYSKSRNHIKIYRKIIDELLNIQKVKNKKIKNFKNRDYKIPYYTNQFLKKEVSLFFDWYLKHRIKKYKKKQTLKKLVYNLLNNFKLKDKVFVHRDFHISNLILKNKNICLIDNQDAVYGNPAYDLCSLVDDVRYKTSNTLKNKLISYYLSKNTIQFSKKDFINDFEIHSVIRNLKIIGIFTRLSMRDKKHQYLKLIPDAWKLIENRLANKKKFNKLNILLREL